MFSKDNWPVFFPGKNDFEIIFTQRVAYLYFHGIGVQIPFQGYHSHIEFYQILFENSSILIVINIWSF